MQTTQACSIDLLILYLEIKNTPTDDIQMNRTRVCEMNVSILQVLSGRF
jgi:hypothetical protein